MEKDKRTKEPISLYPLTPEEALKALLETKPKKDQKAPSPKPSKD